MTLSVEQILNAKTSLIFGTEVILGWRGYMVITNDYIGICVRPGTAGLHIDIECSKVRDNSWMYLTSFVTTQIGIELAAVQRKLPDCVVVGLQLYSARTFHVTLSPRIYKGGQGPPPNNHQHLRQYKPHRT